MQKRIMHAKIKNGVKNVTFTSKGKGKDIPVTGHGGP
jgi:hypothetical protein